MLGVFVPSFSFASLSVVAPNGGENWTIGCPYAIQWLSSNTAGTIKIELYKDNNFCMTICSQVPVTMSSYTWIPPVTVVAAGTYKVKITSLTSAAAFDFSDGNFAINPGTITVTSPNGGEVWQKGSTHQILWTDNICDNVRIELWKGGTLSSVITTSTPSNGSFTWAIPAAVVSGNDYKIKIMSIASATGATSLVFDFSDNNFTIGTPATPITVVTPNGGEVWYSGGSYIIKWIDAIAENVKIELWKNGVFNSVICPSTPGPYTWVIPASVIAGNDYKVKVIGLTSTASYDFSDNNFTIAQGSFIIVTSPNGGEMWAKGSTRIITWQDNIPWDVRIELWKGGAFYSLINASTPSTGSCYWAIPVTLPTGSDYKVRISAVSNAGTAPLADFSDNNFSITGPSPAGSPYGLVKIYPNPGNNVLHVHFTEASATPVETGIYDHAGNLVLRQVTESVAADMTVEMSISSLQNGNYLVVVKQDQRVLSREYLVISR